jgi:hypothetical protein
LDEAFSASLLRETEEGSYEFTHGLVRNTLYAELSTTRRSHRHRQVAHALERTSNPDVAVLAYHFQRAGKSDPRGVDYAAAAGEQALEKLAFDQASTFFRQAIEMAEDAESPAVVHCTLLVRLGVAQRLAADPSYRETLLEASRLAKELGEPELQAEAALANSRGLWSTVGSLDAARVENIEHALEAIGEDDSALRARLLALLALELAWGDPDHRPLAFADEAIAMARRLGDDACLLEVWTAGHLSTKVRTRVPFLASEAPGLVALAERIGNAEQIMLACAWGFSNLLEIGDLDACDRMLDRMHAIAEDLNSPVFRWLGLSFRCCRMTVFATGDEIEETATAALAMGDEAAQPDAMVWFAAQFFTARWYQGRLVEVLDLVRQQVADNPGIPGWIGVLAFSLVACGEIEEATELVRQLPDDLSDFCPDDLIWLVGHSFLSRAVAVVGSPTQAAEYFSILEPYAGRCPCNGVVTLPSIDHNLAVLSVRAGWPEKAEHHFAAANDHHARMRAPVWQAQTEFDWAKFLLTTGDEERARSLLAQAHDRALNIGAADVVTGTVALLASIG